MEQSVFLYRAIVPTNFFPKNCRKQDCRHIRIKYLEFSTLVEICVGSLSADGDPGCFRVLGFRECSSEALGNSDPLYDVTFEW